VSRGGFATSNAEPAAPSQCFVLIKQSDLPSQVFRLMDQGFGFRVHGSRFWVQGSWIKVLGFGFRV
jgi:hypothetical protein